MKKKKKIGVILLSVCVICSVSACQKKGKTPKGDAQNVNASGSLVVGCQKGHVFPA